jgi:hypothetical protein
MALPEDVQRAAALAERCGAAARAVDGQDPRAVALLTDQLDALELALLPALRWPLRPAALPALRDAVGDHRVALSAAGLPPDERRRAVRSLTGLLDEAAALLRAGTPS